MATILVTGASGFVGSHVLPELLGAGHRVVALVRSPQAGRARPSAPARQPAPQAVELRTGDVLAPGTLPAALAGVDAVVHLVAIPRDWNGGKDLLRVNLGGTRNLLAAMREAGVRRLVHLGALGVEDREDLHYAKSKARAEQAVRESGLDWTILKPSLLFGPRDGFFNIVAGLVRIPFPLVPVPGDGRSRFQPLHVADLALCVRLARGAAGDHRPGLRARRPPDLDLPRDHRGGRPRAREAAPHRARAPAPHPARGGHGGGAPPAVLPRRHGPAPPARPRQRRAARRRPSRVRLRSAQNGGRAPVPAARRRSEQEPAPAA